MRRVIGTVLSVFCLMSLVLGLVSAQTNNDIVLYASDAAVRRGNWQVVADATAAGGACIYNPDAGAPKLSAARANPANYFEMTFSAQAGRPYRLWLRSKAQDDFWGNDSVFVQFSGSVNASGAPVFRIGTTSATVVNLEDCSGCGLAGWGWQDNGWGVGVMGPLVYFQSTGTHTIRIQPREDGLAIDQIVLSPGRYLNSSPGGLTNDNVILPRDIPPPANQPPQVSITATPTSGTGPLNVWFNSEAWDPDGYIASYNWTFGDGGSSTVSSPSHIYTAAGSYTARLTVSDDRGATASATVVITVTNQPPPPGGTPLKVLSWNVAFTEGTDDVADINRTAAYIARVNPDLAGLCEIERDGGYGDQVAALVNLLQQRTGRTWYWHFVRKYPGCPEGNLILSKFPFVSTGSIYLSYERSAAQVRINVGGRTINFFATHLDAYDPSIRQRQVDELKPWMAGFAESRIAVGDFNGGPDLPEMESMRSSYYDSWLVAMDAGTAVAYLDNPVQFMTRTRRGRLDYIYYSYGASNLVLTGAEIPDTRDLTNPNVVRFLGTLDDLGVRPSDHNQVIATFVVR